MVHTKTYHILHPNIHVVFDQLWKSNLVVSITFNWFDTEMLSSKIRVFKRQVFRLKKSIRSSCTIFLWINSPGILILNLAYSSLLCVVSMNRKLALLCREISRLYSYYCSIKCAPILFLSLMLINMRQRLRRVVQCPFIFIKID